MANKGKLSEDLKEFEHLVGKDEELAQKLTEFMSLLEKSELDSDNIRLLQDQLNGALDKKLTGKTLIRELQDVSSSNLDQMDQLNQLEFLLNNNHLDSRQASKISVGEKAGRIIKVLIGFLFVTLGFAMIILPAPPYFEMFTVFYFNENDGVTIMDLISLIIIAVGIYIIVKSISNIKTDE